MSKPGPDFPSFTEKNYIPEVVRMDLPMRSAVNLRRVAGELRALAQSLDVLSRSHEDTSVVLLSAVMACERTRKRMRLIRAPGRPRKQKKYLGNGHNI